VKKYEFEITNRIVIEMEGENQDDARVKVIDNLENYSEEMVSDCYVSDGKEIKE